MIIAQLQVRQQILLVVQSSRHDAEAKESEGGGYVTERLGKKLNWRQGLNNTY